jgi:hypothetical protein
MQMFVHVVLEVIAVPVFGMNPSIFPRLFRHYVCPTLSTLFQVLLLYAGGTIGMKPSPSGLAPVAGYVRGWFSTPFLHFQRFHVFYFAAAFGASAGPACIPRP